MDKCLLDYFIILVVVRVLYCYITEVDVARFPLSWSCETSSCTKKFQRI